MARTLRRKVKTNGGPVKTTASTAAVMAIKSCAAVNAPPQIQELQYIMDLERTKAESMKAAYIAQNTQLAKANSSLMMKFSDLEAKISELVQENVVLRSKISANDLKYKERLNDQLQVLEDGITHRFEEIFHMFGRIRKKENLPSEHIMGQLSEPNRILAKQKLKSRQSTHGQRLSNHIQFLESESNEKYFKANDSPYAEKNDNNMHEAVTNSNRKRRKSSRRDSIIVPSDSNFYDEEDRATESRENLNPEEHSPKISNPGFTDTIPPRTLVEEAPRKDSPELLHHKDLQYSTETQQQNTDIPDLLVEKEVENEVLQTQTPEELAEEGSFNFTNSIIEYSIPEETMNSAMNNNETDPPSSSKLEVFRDDQGDMLLPKELLLSDGNDYNNNNNSSMNSPASNDKNDINKATFIPLLQKNKVKHSMRPPNSRSGKKIIDEVMPGAGLGDLDLRSRRTRGKAINYALPSLRAKMRRPTEKLVDATTITNIHDLQVSRRSKRFKTDQVIERAETHNNEKTKPAETYDSSRINSNLAKDISSMSENDLRKEVSLRDENKKIQNNYLKPILRDITNKPNPKPSRTKKLYKKAIINDMPDNNDLTSEEHTAKFPYYSGRSHEQELSVFDLIESNNIKPAQKTYRAKVKKVLSYK